MKRLRAGRRGRPANPNRIVVRTPNWLGDVVMSTPGFHALRSAYPAAEIVGLVPEPFLPLLEGSPDFDALWPLGPGGRGDRELKARLEANRFDLGILIPESISSALLLRRAGVRHVVGFGRDPVRRSLLHEEVRAPAEWGRRRRVAKEQFVLRLMAAVGAPCEDTRLRLVVTERDEARLAEVLAESGVPRDALGSWAPILIAPGAAYGSAKCWPIESFAALANQLLDSRTVSRVDSARGDGIDAHPGVILIGSAGERARLEAIVDAMRPSGGSGRVGRPLVFAGNLDLGALKALFREASLLVGNDSGARHVAAAFGVPSVIFFGPTSVDKTPENLDTIEILETEHDCRPCYLRECPIDHRCLRSISAAEAAAAVERALSRKAPLREAGGGRVLALRFPS